MLFDIISIISRTNILKTKGGQNIFVGLYIYIALGISYWSTNKSHFLGNTTIINY